MHLNACGNDEDTASDRPSAACQAGVSKPDSDHFCVYFEHTFLEARDRGGNQLPQQGCDHLAYLDRPTAFVTQSEASSDPTPSESAFAFTTSLAAVRACVSAAASERGAEGTHDSFTGYNTGVTTSGPHDTPPASSAESCV